MKELLKLRGKIKDEFYQSKYEHYKRFNILALAAYCIAFIILFASDYDIYHYLEWSSLLRRSLVLIPLAVVAAVYRKTDNYKIMSALSFIIVHAIIWTNIWVTSCLPDQSYANDNFIFMGFLLLIVSYCAPLRYALIAQWGLVWDIILSDGIMHYQDLNIMVAYNCQVVVMINIVSLIVTKLYYDHYIDNKKLHRMSFHDPLTQVFNRNKLDDLMDISRELSYISKSISIMIVDIDYFKKVNDTYGHDKGDLVLQFIADHIKHSLRMQDIIIRWGGEEFVAILPDCTQDQASAAAERMRKGIADSDNGICKVTVSVGVARYDGGDCTETIKKADEALYRAKSEGRNRVIHYEGLKKNDV